MNPTPKIRRLGAHEWPTYRALRLRALADSPEAFGRTLAEEAERPDSFWSERLSAAVESGLDLPLVAEVKGKPVGLAWGRVKRSDTKVVNLYQMWVAPKHRGLGGGRTLLDTVIAWARTKEARCVELGVTFRDSPAMRLYTRAGFEPVGKPEPMREGSDVLGQMMHLDLVDKPAR